MHTDETNYQEDGAAQGQPNAGTPRGLPGLATRLRGWRHHAAAVADSPLARQLRAALTHELPEWLLEVSALTAVEWGDARTGLARGLDQLAHVCDEEANTLRQRRARTALALKLSVDRVLGTLIPLEAALARSTAAMRRSDPRLASVGAAFGTVGYAASMIPGVASPAATSATTSGPLVILSARDARKLADRLRTVLRAAEHAGRSIHISPQTTRMDGIEAIEGIAGAIEQAQTLVAWVRQECEGVACQLRRAPIAHL